MPSQFKYSMSILYDPDTLKWTGQSYSHLVDDRVLSGSAALTSEAVSYSRLSALTAVLRAAIDKHIDEQIDGAGDA